jgi:two-component system, sensor histidine kinase and response regulator
VGYQVTVASDGFQALEACKREEYHLILMDIQMPGMDGYETTLRIRAGEGWLHGVPVLAFTANADDKTLQECLAAGMNGVITKPFRREFFLNEIARWFTTLESAAAPGPEDQPASLPPGQPDGELPVMDYDTVLREFSGNRTLLDSLVKSFLLQATRQMDVLEEALRCHDADTLGKEAHKIKGAAGNLMAVRLSAKAKELEMKGKSGDLSGADVLLREFKKELEEFGKFVKNGYRIGGAA